jgi:hypothetical protein
MGENRNGPGINLAILERLRLASGLLVFDQRTHCCQEKQLVCPCGISYQVMFDGVG